MEAGRAGRSSVIGSAMLRMEKVPSTNSLASQLASSGCPEGTVVTADMQTAGRGRRGRTWHSPAGGGLWFSVVLSPPLPPSRAQVLTFLGAVAVARALKSIGIRVGLKWPNDIMWHGKKMGGVLTESVVSGGQMRHAVVGIGLNVAIKRGDFPAELRGLAATASGAGGKKVDGGRLLRGILREMDRLYLALRQPGGSGALMREWRALAGGLGRKAVLREGERRWEGIISGFGPDGSLILRMGSGEEKVFHSGEVTVLKKPR